MFYLFDRFQHLKGQELHESMELREHAATVMATLDQSINSLGDYDNFVSYLHSIGQLHRKVPGFKREYFWKIEQPFMKAVKQTLDERCNDTIESIYVIAIKLIIETIAQGYGQNGDWPEPGGDFENGNGAGSDGPDSGSGRGASDGDGKGKGKGNGANKGGNKNSSLKSASRSNNAADKNTKNASHQTKSQSSDGALNDNNGTKIKQNSKNGQQSGEHFNNSSICLNQADKTSSDHSGRQSNSCSETQILAQSRVCATSQLVMGPSKANRTKPGGELERQCQRQTMTRLDRDRQTADNLVGGDNGNGRCQTIGTTQDGPVVCGQSRGLEWARTNRELTWPAKVDRGSSTDRDPNQDGNRVAAKATTSKTTTKTTITIPPITIRFPIEPMQHHSNNPASCLKVSTKFQPTTNLDRSSEPPSNWTPANELEVAKSLYSNPCVRIPSPISLVGLVSSFEAEAAPFKGRQPNAEMERKCDHDEQTDCARINQHKVSLLASAKLDKHAGNYADADQANRDKLQAASNLQKAFPTNVHFTETSSGISNDGDNNNGQRKTETEVLGLLKANLRAQVTERGSGQTKQCHDYNYGHDEATAANNEDADDQEPSRDRDQAQANEIAYQAPIGRLQIPTDQSACDDCANRRSGPPAQANSRECQRQGRFSRRRYGRFVHLTRPSLPSVPSYMRAKFLSKRNHCSTMTITSIKASTNTIAATTFARHQSLARCPLQQPQLNNKPTMSEITADKGLRQLGLASDSGRQRCQQSTPLGQQDKTINGRQANDKPVNSTETSKWEAIMQKFLEAVSKPESNMPDQQMAPGRVELIKVLLLINKLHQNLVGKSVSNRISAPITRSNNDNLKIQ